MFIIGLILLVLAGASWHYQLHFIITGAAAAFGAFMCAMGITFKS